MERHGFKVVMANLTSDQGTTCENCLSANTCTFTVISINLNGKKKSIINNNDNWVNKESPRC